MPRIRGGIKLSHGTAEEIARGRGCSGGHVRQVAQGARQGAPDLIAEIKRLARRDARREAAKRRRFDVEGEAA